MNSSSKARPLEGVRVLDFTHAAAGPFAAMLLGDMGAEIIKIEKPGDGEGSRQMGLPVSGLGRKQSDYFFGMNRNKKSVAIDLHASKGLGLVLQLVQKSDIIIQNFRPGVMDRLGLGFDALRKMRPHLIYCSISGYGTKGPWAGLPANDVILQSLTGLMGMTGEADRAPVKSGAAICDLTTGLFALSGILGAVCARDRHPEGQHVEVSMLESALNLMCNYIPSAVSLGKRVPRLGHAHAQIVPYQGFECSDGEYIMVGAFSRKFWINLCNAVEHPEWVQDQRFRSNASRVANKDILVAALSDIFRSKPRAEWERILTENDVPNSPVYNLDEVVKTDHVRQMDVVRDLGTDDHKLAVVGFPVRVAAWDGDRFGSPAPGLGAHTREILQNLLSIGSDEFNALAQQKIIETEEASADVSGSVRGGNHG